jgi:hypothetical protein
MHSDPVGLFFLHMQEVSLKVSLFVAGDNVFLSICC